MSIIAPVQVAAYPAVGVPHIGAYRQPLGLNTGFGAPLGGFGFGGLNTGFGFSGLNTGFGAPLGGFNTFNRGFGASMGSFVAPPMATTIAGPIVGGSVTTPLTGSVRAPITTSIAAPVTTIAQPASYVQPIQNLSNTFRAPIAASYGATIGAPVTQLGYGSAFGAPLGSTIGAPLMGAPVYGSSLNFGAPAYGNTYGARAPAYGTTTYGARYAAPTTQEPTTTEATAA